MEGGDFFLTEKVGGKGWRGFEPIFFFIGEPSNKLKIEKVLKALSNSMKHNLSLVDL